MMKLRCKLTITFCLALFILGGLSGAGKTTAYRQKKGLTEATSSLAPQKQTGWFQRPAGAGDYQEVMNFPDMERPATLANLLPVNRDLAAYCSIQTKVYRDSLSENQLALTNLEAQKLSELDLRILQLPRLQEKLGNLATYNGDMDQAINRLEISYRLLNESLVTVMIFFLYCRMNRSRKRFD